MLKKNRNRRLRRVLAAGVALSFVAAACASDDDGGSSDTAAPSATDAEPEPEPEPEPDSTEPATTDAEAEPEAEAEAEPMALEGRTIKFWSTETQPERLAATQDIIDRFEDATGANVELTAADEGQLPSLMLVNAASGTLPDVVFHPVDFTTGWAAQGLLDVDAAAQVVDNLGADTFSAGALQLVSVDGTPAAVPSDGWGQLLVYRKDLFDAAGLAAPDTFAASSPRPRRCTIRVAPASTASPPRRRSTCSPSRPGSTWRWPTVASSPTAPPSPSTRRTASRRSTSTRRRSTTSRSRVSRTSSRPGPRTSPARRR